MDQEPVASRQAIGEGMRRVLAQVEVLAAQGSRPVVLACWQDEAYVDVPPGVLDRLAEIADLTVACTGRLPMRPTVCHIPLDTDDALTHEWSLVALTPDDGVALIAHEVDATLPAGTVEGGRAFRFDVSDEPAVIVAHARRLERSFGARMTPDAAAVVAAAITTLATVEIDAEFLDVVADRVRAAVDAADDTRREQVPVPSDAGGLATLAHWLADAGPRAPALGLVVVRAGSRGVAQALRDHAHALGRVGDLTVDVPPDAAMIVLPGLRGEALEQRAEEACALVSEALATGDVRSCAVEVPAEDARRDLVGSLGRALAELRVAERSSAA